MKKIAILGSTGSIGVNTLKVIAEFPDKFQVLGLSAGDNFGLLARQVQQFRPQIVSLRQKEAADNLRREISDKSIEIESGIEGAIKVASMVDVDMVVSAIVGAAGLIPTCAALKMGKIVALANKETLVMAGPVIKRLLAEKGGQILPVDSEHSAIFQCLQGQKPEHVAKIILTASGGPFLHYSMSQLESVTPQQALKHPTWRMGAKISLDSATLMNKGLEVIEAYWLFNKPAEKIEVVIHPQSVIHSMIELADGSVLAQLGVADMRNPILYALSYPERFLNQIPKLKLTDLQPLTFAEPDTQRFPCLKLAYQALLCGESLPVVLNAANEVAGKAFLSGRIRFNQIPLLIESAMSKHKAERLSDIECALAVDSWTRAEVKRMLE
ncbi:MAG: 1-deoxy-D-xylulose-5-phosphate reductoisomerase [Candidatus Schekmanbacteria bacterium]|nr:1-deoxy-D-xylulose-5-phosphate reductoisomerase [Candidatus Schekmanbacteria bacterium]